MRRASLLGYSICPLEPQGGAVTCKNRMPPIREWFDIKSTSPLYCRLVLNHATVAEDSTPSGAPKGTSARDYLLLISERNSVSQHINSHADKKTVTEENSKTPTSYS